MFDQFNKVEILISIDSIGKQFEIERSGVWKNIEHHIKQYAALCSQKVSIKLSTTVNIQNLLYLDQLVEFANGIGIDIVWIYLEQPEYLCIDNVTQTVKDLVYQKYHNHPNVELSKISERLQTTAAVSGNKFLEYTHKIDQRRGQEFFKTHSEIYAAMGGQIDR
jgi:MoaA/NifB/PqqE/SkfB family radical SAM enzyme